MPKFIKDPGPILDPGNPKLPPPDFFPKVEIFHKNEGELFEEIKQTYLALDENNKEEDLNIVELLLPAVQFQSFAFVKVEGEQDEGTLDAILIGLSEEYDGSVLLPGVQAADHAAGESFNKSSPDMLLRFDGLDGESQDTPEQSAWDPLDGFG